MNMACKRCFTFHNCMLVISVSQLLTLFIIYKAQIFSKLTTNCFNIHQNLSLLHSVEYPYTDSLLERHKNEKIPFIIWQTGPTHDIVDYSSVLSNQINHYKNMGFEYHLIDDKQLRSLFTDSRLTSSKEYEILGNITKAFLMLNPTNGAALSDLWRYYVLWKYGGIYIDLDATCNFSLNKIQHILEQHSQYKNDINVPFAILSNEHWYFEYGPYENQPKIIQYMIMISKRHPFLEETINRITIKILSNDIPTLKDIYQQTHSNYPGMYMHEVTVRTTGPDIWTNAILDIINNKLYDKYEYYINGTAFDGSFQCKNRFNEGLKQKIYETKRSYDEMFYNNVSILVDAD